MGWNRSSHGGFEMIARVWKGTTTAEDGAAYADYMAATGVVEIESLAGNRGIIVTRRVIEGVAEFTFISLWDSMESIVRFSGPDPSRAVFYPEDDRYLVTRWRSVEHHEVVGGYAAGDRFGAPNTSLHAAQTHDPR
jgi:heme-degrading monooxygenase HmoA